MTSSSSLTILPLPEYREAIRMAARSSLFDLFEADLDHEPSAHTHQQVINTLVRDPNQLQCLASEDIKVYFTTRWQRFVELFRRLHSTLQQDSPEINSITAATAELLVQLIPDVLELLGLKGMILPLVEALRVCLSSRQPAGLQRLARELCNHNSLLEYLVADFAGSEVIKQWCNLPRTLGFDLETYVTWTERFAKMTTTCSEDHGITHACDMWENLQALRGELHKWKSELALRETRNAQASSRIPSQEMQELLSKFGLAIPQSSRMVQNHVEFLSDKASSSILRSIVESFPCKLCIEALSSPHQAIRIRAPMGNSETFSELPSNILGKGLGVWKTILGRKAVESCTLLSQKGCFESTDAKLRLLASGDFSTASSWHSKHLRVPLMLTKCEEETFILSQVSFGIDGERHTPQQILVIWGVGDLDTLSSIVEKVITLQQSYTEEKVRYCHDRSHPATDGKYIPKPYGEEALRRAQPENSTTSNMNSMDPKTIEMAHKFYVLTEPVMKSIADNDLAAEFPLDTSKDEARCISYIKSNSLILGRSGTGKSTCLIMKLVGKYLCSKLTSSERVVRQVLLTRSNYLAEKLENYTKGLIATSVSVNTSAHQAPDIQKHIANDPYQSHNDLRSFTEASYPLVSTFDRFLQLLENTAFATDRQNFAKHDAAHDQVSDLQQSRKGRLVDFHAFKLKYWPRFFQDITKGFSPHLVFAEIMGVIKGSESSRGTLCPLTREEYLKRSSRLAPTFTAEEERSRVYGIFKRYEELKLHNCDLDGVDRVVKLLEELRKRGSLRRLYEECFEEIYVDEIQDHRCLDFELFFSIGCNGRGFHFAGDTAQAISPDCTFRFADVKKMLFDQFRIARETTKQKDLGHAEMFLLSKNYRSHQGILRVASLVMDLIWRGFPETVDKLQPECGDRLGPKPVLLIGCDIEILLKGSIGSGRLSERSSEFGAEQAILVRDENAKTNLKSQIGNAALVFTVQESKGMEFDDIILWNFFTQCPDQPGIRSLLHLKMQSGNFDTKAHSSMCVELKNLYVAVTRARTQLFIVETSRDASIFVERLFSHDKSSRLMDISRKGDQDFAFRVEMMRPTSAVSTTSWARKAGDLMKRRMYQDAVMAFQKAKDREGETKAQALFNEDEADRLHGSGNVVESQRNLEDACRLFLEIWSTNDAVRVLVKFSQNERAARICMEDQQYLRAAGLFLDAKLGREAYYCYDKAGQHSKAAQSLQNLECFDELVRYLSIHADMIPAGDIKRYSLLCKLLLKRGKLNDQNRSAAIKLLGSSEEQEVCFIEYKMDNDLAKLYTQQARHSDLFYLYRRTGRLEQALSLAIDMNLLVSPKPVKASELLHLLDYVWSGYSVSGNAQQLSTRLKSRASKLTPRILCSIREWEAVRPFFQVRNLGRLRNIEQLDPTRAKEFLCFQKVLSEKAFDIVSDVDNLSVTILQTAIRTVTQYVLNDNADAQRIVSLVTGLWKSDDPTEQEIVLPWSPIGTQIEADRAAANIHVAKDWVLNGFSSAILSLDRQLNELWQTKLSKRCVPCMTKDFYALKQPHKWDKLHEQPSSEDSAKVLKFVLNASAIFCDLTTLYYHRIFNEDFQRNFLGIRRRWLERLLRDLTFVSPLEQSSGSITSVRSEIFRNHQFVAVRSSLEQLLYFRIRMEWDERKTFAALVEQLQATDSFDPRVRYPLSQALSHRLCETAEGSWMQRHLSLMSRLKSEIWLHPAATYHKNFINFFQSFDGIDIRDMSALHSLTTLFEYFTTLLLIMICDTASLVKQSWLDLYIAQMKKAPLSARPPQETQGWKQKYLYSECLVELVFAFCKILHRSKEVSKHGFKVACCGQTHPWSLLRQRNIEMLAIIVVNLLIQNPLHKDAGQARRNAGVVLNGDSYGIAYAKTQSPGELGQKLASSISKYKGKERLLLMVKDGKMCPAFAKLGLDRIPLDQLYPDRTPLMHATSSQTSSTLLADNASQDQYAETDVLRVTKIQGMWRSCIQSIKKRHAWRQNSECQEISRYIKLGSFCPDNSDRLPIRGVLLEIGVPLSLRLAKAKEMLAKLQEDSTKCIDQVEISVGIDEVLDNILCQNTKAGSFLMTITELLSDSRLIPAVEQGLKTEIESQLGKADGLLKEAEGVLLAATVAIDGMLTKSD